MKDIYRIDYDSALILFVDFVNFDWWYNIKYNGAYG